MFKEMYYLRFILFISILTLDLNFCVFMYIRYGDKSPKSIVARIFSIIWIMLGLISMAIFTANVTSALTAVSLELTPSSLNGVKVKSLN